MRILIAGNDREQTAAIVSSLRSTGHAVDHVDSGSRAEAALAQSDFDLVIVDIGIGGVAGPTLVSRLRVHNRAVPLIALPKSGRVEERIRALDEGADECLGMPFSLEEVQARVRKWSRRTLGTGTAVVKHGPVSFDTIERRVKFDGEQIALSRRELSLFESLLKHTGRFVDKEQLIDNLFEWENDVTANAIEVYVHRLRQKLARVPVRIVTSRGLGYCLTRTSA